MARDVLAIQASSVASEGVFSVARFQSGEHMHSIAADSLENLYYLETGLMPREEIWVVNHYR